MSLSAIFFQRRVHLLRRQGGFVLVHIKPLSASACASSLLAISRSLSCTTCTMLSNTKRTTAGCSPLSFTASTTFFLEDLYGFSGVHIIPPLYSGRGIRSPAGCQSSPHKISSAQSKNQKILCLISQISRPLTDREVHSIRPGISNLLALQWIRPSTWSMAMSTKATGFAAAGPARKMGVFPENQPKKLYRLLQPM